MMIRKGNNNNLVLMHAARMFLGQVIEMSRVGSTNSSPRVSGRDFLKLMAAAGIVMTFRLLLTGARL
jgi:hypothetical protein